MKRILSMALAVLAAASFAACGRSGGESGRRKLPGYEEGKTNIVFYTWGSDAELKILDDMVLAFEDDNPDYNIVVQEAGNDYYSDLELQIAGSMSPDIVQMKPGYIQNYLRSGALVDLQPYIDASETIDEETMIWDVNDRYRYDAATKTPGTGDIYSLVKDFSPDFILAYDKHDVDACAAKLSGLDYPKEGDTLYPSKTVPMTWTQFRAFAEALQTSGRMGTHLDNEPLQQLMQWIEQSGASLWSEDHKKVVDIANTPDVKKAFDYYRQLRDECTDNTPVAKNSSVQVGGGQMKQDQCASIFIGRWASVGYEWEGVANFEPGYAPTPIPDGMTFGEDSRTDGITAMVGLSISARSPNKDAAWKFIEYYFTHMRDLAELGYNIPGNKVTAQEYFLGNAEDSQLTASVKEVNAQYYSYADKHSFVIGFNRYMSQSRIEDIMSTALSSYFADSKGKPYSAQRWKQALDSIMTDLQTALDKEVKRAER